jgi:hypothetical protein
VNPVSLSATNTADPVAGHVLDFSDGAFHPYLPTILQPKGFDLALELNTIGGIQSCESVGLGGGLELGGFLSGGIGVDTTGSFQSQFLAAASLKWSYKAGQAVVLQQGALLAPSADNPNQNSWGASVSSL